MVIKPNENKKGLSGEHYTCITKDNKEFDVSFDQGTYSDFRSKRAGFSFKELVIEPTESGLKIFRPIPNFDGAKVRIYSSLEKVPSFKNRSVTLEYPSKKHNYINNFHVFLGFGNSTSNITINVFLESKADTDFSRVIYNGDSYSHLSKSTGATFVIAKSTVKNEESNLLELYLSSITTLFNNSILGLVENSIKDLFINLIRQIVLDLCNIKFKPRQTIKRPGIIDDLKTDHFGDFDPIKLEDWKEIRGEYKGLKYEVVPRSYDDIWVYYLCGYIYVPHKKIRNFNVAPFWDEFFEDGIDVDYVKNETYNGSTVYKVGFTTDHFGYKMEEYTPEVTENICKKIIAYTIKKIDQEA